MIRFRYFFLLVIWAGTLSGVANVSAQSGTDVLVSAGGQTLRQSEVDQLIKFYEWASGTEFTAPQRKRYRELKEEEFRNDPVQAKKGVGELGGYLSQILVKSEGEQAKMRDAFNAGFIPDLRKATDDAEAQFLLNIYDDAKRNAGSGEADPADDPGAGSISNLVGKWVWANTGSTSWNSSTGAYAGGNGSRFTYEFSPGGGVEYTGMMNVMMGGCSQQVFMSKKGRASVNGGALTIKWMSGSSTRDFSCDRANNYTKTLPAETEYLAVSFKSNSTGQKLFCTKTNGKEDTCFSPAQ
jgi:hypothetical protein